MEFKKPRALNEGEEAVEEIEFVFDDERLERKVAGGIVRYFAWGEFFY